MPRARTRDRLLDAAGAVVRRDGAQALTLDAVAEEAEVSKGGLLYHFKSKRELVEGMVERWLGEFQHEIDAADAAFVRGYVKASAPAGNELGMLAALIADPALLVTVRRQYGIWQDRVEREGRDPVDATVARLAADGLWLAELLGMGPPTGELRARVLERLLELAAPD
jgi:AcrR family transcriptional regulator